ncbi:cytochrome P450 [Gloeopeniophorella convolvens]|nr:cytochrome P450 [Gloeopeniophorella convolvens]
MGPAFNNSMYSLVWAETMRVYRDMVSAEGWTNKDTVILQPVQDYTVRVALFVISACGFGLPFRWEEPPVNEDGSMGFQEAMRIWVDTVLLRVIAPKWVYKLPLKGLRKIATSTQVLQEYMGRMIAERKAEINGGEAVKGKERRDVFSLLVRANEEEGKDGKRKLEDSELFGNVFAMLFAGHETTAFTLAATVGFLGIYPQIQEDVYQQIIEVVGHDRDPTFEDFPRLEKVANAFYEALRLYPAAHFMIRAPSEDTILTVPTGDGTSTRPVPIQKDLHVIVDMTGIQYNPRYFPNPYKYDPTRWRGITTESEDVTAFSVGPRTCIGRKFAAVEAVCFLTFLLKDWAVEPIMNPGETGEQWRERVMHAQTKMTLCVDPVPVRLLRRRPATST